MGCYYVVFQHVRQINCLIVAGVYIVKSLVHGMHENENMVDTYLCGVQYSAAVVFLCVCLYANYSSTYIAECTCKTDEFHVSLSKTWD